MTPDRLLSPFIDAIHAKKKIRLRFYSLEDRRVIERTCAPLDYGPSRMAGDKTNWFHVWDYDSGDGVPHSFRLSPERVAEVIPLADAFDPVALVTWDVRRAPWSIPRDWGLASLPRQSRTEG